MNKSSFLRQNAVQESLTDLKGYPSCSNENSHANSETVGSAWDNIPAQGALD
jgi:hypothetical protein